MNSPTSFLNALSSDNAWLFSPPSPDFFPLVVLLLLALVLLLLVVLELFVVAFPLCPAAGTAVGAVGVTLVGAALAGVAVVVGVTLVGVTMVVGLAGGTVGVRAKGEYAACAAG